MTRTDFKYPALCLGALALTAGAALLSASPPVAAADGQKRPPAAAKSPVKGILRLTEDEKIVHVLNRLGYGPRPHDVERVKAIGLSRYIDLQLNPDRVADAEVDRKLASFTTLALSGDALGAEYHELMQATRQVQVMRQRAKKQEGNQTGAAGAAGAAPEIPGEPDRAAMRKRAMAMDPAARREAMQSRQMIMQAAAPVARAHEEFMAAKVLRAVASERQLQEVLVDFWGNHFNIDIRKQPCGVLKILDDREAIRPHVFGKFRDLLGSSAKSPAMLVYLDNNQSMAENASSAADPPPGLMARRLRMIARRRMLMAPGAPMPAVPPKAKNSRPSGLNENYAREIMELHTLGVDGGYTQQDVREVARCLTGWTVASGGGRRAGAGKYAEAGAYRFDPAMHDDGQKTVLGHVIPAGGGERDGEMVLDILASHPATMRHISEQLCQRFVADEPPATLVASCVAAWKRTDGDLREIVRTIVTSPEFYSAPAMRSKIQSPFEYAVSSVRALGGTYETAADAGMRQPRQAISLIKPPKGGGFLDMGTTSLVGQVGTIGQPLFQYQAPTGYPEDSRKWVSSGALISRLNFALALTAGKLDDVKLQSAESVTSDPHRAIDQAAAEILHAPISPATRATLLKQVSPASKDTGARLEGLTTRRIAALLLGSPEFQRH